MSTVTRIGITWLAILCLTALIALLITHSTTPSVLAALKPCPDEVYHIVLSDTLNKFPQYNYLDVWLSHNYDEAYWKPLLDEEQLKIDRLRAWSRTLPDPCFRKHYAGWLDYYQGYLDSAWHELRTQSERKHMEKYDKANDAQTAAERKYREAHTIPRPPE